MKTPAQIAGEVADRPRIGTYTNSRTIGGAGFRRAIAVAAIEADRAQRQPEIYIVMNAMGDLVDAFRDGDEATAAYQERYIVCEMSLWEPGEYAKQRIATLTRAWEDATDSVASDYALSGDDWVVGLGEEEGAEIERLIRYVKEAN